MCGCKPARFRLAWREPVCLALVPRGRFLVHALRLAHTYTRHFLHTSSKGKVFTYSPPTFSEVKDKPVKEPAPEPEHLFEIR